MWYRIKQITAITLTIAIVGVSGGMLYLQAHGGNFLSIQSGSMVPIFRKGDLVVVTRVPASALKAGDVVTFINPANTRQTITHRLIRVPTRMSPDFQTKGDANPAADKPIAAAAIQGKVRAGIPKLGFGLDFVRRPLGLVLLIYIPALLICIHEIRLLARHYKDSEPYVLAGYSRHLKKGSPARHQAATAVKAIAVMMVAGIAAASPAFAALSSQATFAGSTISVKTGGSGGQNVQHMLIRKVTMDCSTDNTATANYLVSIQLYNPTKKNISAGNWSIRSSAGLIRRFPAKTIFKKSSNYDIQPDLKNGLKFAGDFLALYDNNHTVVDGISWGTDTTQFDPSLGPTQAGTRFRRVPAKQDTNTAGDWQVTLAKVCKTKVSSPPTAVVAPNVSQPQAATPAAANPAPDTQLFQSDSQQAPTPAPDVNTPAATPLPPDAISVSPPVPTNN
jgi:signal peptidase